ncbi:MAG: ABC-type transport auxiliary lipoprotein family protein [Pseudomonadota bacterium]
MKSLSSHLRTRFTSPVSVAFAAFTLAGCSVLSGSAPDLDTYDISAPTSFPALSGSTAAQILVAAPTSLKLLNSDRIVVRAAGNEVTYLPEIRLPDTLPNVLQLKLSETFVNSDRFGGVGLPGQGLLIDYQLVSVVRAFEIRPAGGGFVARAEISAKLVNDRNGVVRASRVFLSEVPAVSEGRAAASALDQAFDAVAIDLADWILGAI